MDSATDFFEDTAAFEVAMQAVEATPDVTDSRLLLAVATIRHEQLNPLAAARALARIANPPVCAQLLYLDVLLQLFEAFADEGALASARNVVRLHGATGLWRGSSSHVQCSCAPAAASFKPCAPTTLLSL